jgi:HPt (histidine-containing phosphotransfer) domain-containing protein
MGDQKNIVDMTIVDGLLDLEKHGLKGFFGRQVDIFTSKAPGYYELIVHSYRSNSPKNMVAAAHKFNGFASSLGAMELRRICIDLEKLGQSGSVQQCGELIDELEDCLSQTLTQLTEISRKAAS